MLGHECFPLLSVESRTAYATNDHITHLVEQPRSCRGWRGQLAIVVHGSIPIT